MVGAWREARMSDDRLRVWWGKVEYLAPPECTDEQAVLDLLRNDFDYVHDPDYVIVQRGVLLDWHLRLRQPNNRGVVRSGDALIALGFKRIDTE